MNRPSDRARARAGEPGSPTRGAPSSPTASVPEAPSPAPGASATLTAHDDVLRRLVARAGRAARLASSQELLSLAERFSAPALIWSLPRRRPLFANRRLALLLGLEAGVAARSRARAVGAAIHPEDAPALADVIAGLGRGERRAVEAAFRVLHCDGAWRWLHGRFAALTRRRDGSALLAGGVIEDVTVQHALAERLRQAQKMEAVGRLAGGIAHDFNNLLTAIMGSAETVQRELGPGHALAPVVDEVLVAADRAAALTQQLLAFGRKQVLHARVVDLDEVIAESEQLLRRLIGEHIEVVTRRSPDAGCVRIDPAQLEQVILNLAVNARDAMPDGGTLTIETRAAELDAADAARYAGMRPGRYAVLVVRDTGIGMDTETRARVFEPFFTTRAAAGGTGLGLSTVYGVVKQSQGFVYVDSAPGAGASFTVFLPAADGPPEPLHAPPPDPARSARRRTVLLVEDDDAVRGVVRGTLEYYGYEVLSAEHGTTALARAEQRDAPVDLVLADVILPGMSGIELWRRLRERHPAARVLFISGYPQGTVGSVPADLRDAEFLPKPFTSGQLAARVREILDPA